MEFRKAAASDIDGIMKIIKQAQAYFKENGVNQWQNNYPNNETIKEDIRNGYGYVLEDSGEIIGTVAVSFDGEKTYDIIYGGEWISSGEYAVIHRMAVDNAYKGAGLSSVIIKHIENICLDKGVHSIKIDTHNENISMQRVIKKNNFKYCGIIYVEDKSSRLAFEKYFNLEKPDTPIDIDEPINMVSGDYEFVVSNDNTVTITKYTGKDISIEIPGEIDGKKVTAIGNTSKEIGAFQDYTKLV